MDTCTPCKSIALWCQKHPMPPYGLFTHKPSLCAPVCYNSDLVTEYQTAAYTLHFFCSFKRNYKCSFYLRWCYTSSQKQKLEVLVSLIFPWARAERTSDPGVDTGFSHWCLRGNVADGNNPDAIVVETHSFCVFRSVAFIKCNGVAVNYEWRTTLWAKRMMQIIHPCFLDATSQQRDFTPKGWGLYYSVV